MEKKEFACECMNYGSMGVSGVLTISEVLLFKPIKLPLSSSKKELSFSIGDIVHIEKKTGLFTGPLINLRLKDGAVITFKTFGRDGIIECIETQRRLGNTTENANNQKFCTNCGAKNSVSAIFCSMCGNRL